MDWLLDHWFEVSTLVLLGFISINLPTPSSLDQAVRALDNKLNSILDRLSEIERQSR